MAAETSFMDILIQKIRRDEVNAVAASAPPPIYIPLDNPLPDFSNAPSPKLQRDLKRTSYARVQSPSPAASGPPPKPQITVEPPVRRFSKSNLSEDASSKWARFEKMIRSPLNEPLSLQELQQLFRRFIRSVHPDLNTGAEKHNVALYVKIKNELISALTAQK